MNAAGKWNWTALRASAGDILRRLRRARSVGEARRVLYQYVTMRQYGVAEDRHRDSVYYIARDCARALRGMFTERAERLSEVSLAAVLRDLSRGRCRHVLNEAFYAEMIHLFDGLKGRAVLSAELLENNATALKGRAAALARSDELDRLWNYCASWMERYEDGLSKTARARREARRRRILDALGGAESDWSDWRWQCAHVLVEPKMLVAAVDLSEEDRAAVQAAHEARVPFGVTPYYASLMDDGMERRRDRAIRAQVLPPMDYVRRMASAREARGCLFDFMLEHDTSPVELVTRRYPAIAILKPFNTCPQICVYCQRNWEIEAPMAPNALAPWSVIEAACAWIEAHPAVREVLVTGGDPLALDDDALLRVLERLAAIQHVDLIRIGTRVPVTLPMRITETLADRLARLRIPGHREIAVVTHVEHPYEVTPDLTAAVERLRRRGIGVYNQLVYTFYVSRRFEATALRMLLRRAGIDPYYTFLPKGKEEVADYRVPLARLLQEQKEEARLLPGTRRADEAVVNLPGLGKNNIRAAQHRDLLSIRPDGARVYEFHPWEKNVVHRVSYIGTDVPILDYLRRLEAVGENPDDYSSIWYYF